MSSGGSEQKENMKTVSRREAKKEDWQQRMGVIKISGAMNKQPTAQHSDEIEFRGAIRLIASNATELGIESRKRPRAVGLIRRTE